MCPGTFVSTTGYPKTVNTDHMGSFDLIRLCVILTDDSPRSLQLPGSSGNISTPSITLAHGPTTLKHSMYSHSESERTSPLYNAVPRHNIFDASLQQTPLLISWPVS